ncbi:hypothetical protein V7S43_018447 [Phytophthora oleae]|uniref:Crinkler effector protein N-terminal domain-containing protein n=1 Tax=Phytophthora oleae TaxID=2107226 RepID=A0ABD3EQF6_9STRA
MVYLINCFAVGEEESVLSVVIEEWKTVAFLKVAIADMLKYTGRADKLLLYLARNDDVWLTEDQAAAVAFNNLGHSQGFKEMKPLLFIKNPENFGATFQPGENQVHVLVKLPADSASIGPSVGLPRTTELNEPEKYAEECISLDDWDVDAVHKIL